MEDLKDFLLDHWMVCLFAILLFSGLTFEVIYLSKVAPVANLQVTPESLVAPAPKIQTPLPKKCKAHDSAADYYIESWQFRTIYNATMNSGSFMGSSL